jgi:hypothetical protein
MAETAAGGEKKERFIQFKWIWIEAPRVKSMDDERWMM